MKNAVLIFVASLTAATSFAQAKYATFEAKIANKNGDKVFILGPKYKKEIGINKQGFFKDTLKITEGLYRFYDGKEGTMVYLRNGYDLKMKLNAQEFDETIIYTGTGSKENNFLAKEALLEENFDFEGALASNEADFAKKLADKKNGILERLNKGGLDAKFIAFYKKDVEANSKDLEDFYKQNLEIRKLNGSKSPSFNYENHKGGTTSLEDLRGKYVYIDVWATWCGPCRAEIPHLKEVEKKYHNKNIEFVSISIDTKKDYEKWKKFVTEKELGGIQLYADSDWNSQFVKDYSINGIPRFILIDPKGNIVNANADRPSSPRLVETLDQLLK